MKDAMLPKDIDDVRAILVEREGRIVGLIRRVPGFGWKPAPIRKSRLSGSSNAGSSSVATRIF
jgi:hypothetical protein